MRMNGLQFKDTLINGTAIVKYMQDITLPATVWALPVAGDTITVSYSLDGGTTYLAWELGDITSASSEKALMFYSGVTHIKWQRTAGAGITSTCGVC